jgi:hypothetical protein
MGKRRKCWRDKPNVDWVIGWLKNIEEEVKPSSGGDDPDVTDTDPLLPVFDWELHSWARNP